MGNEVRYTGLSFNNLRKALYYMFFGVDYIYDKNGKVIGSRADDFNSPKYKYIIPMQGNFDNPLEGDEAKDTFLMYWIERDESFTQDSYTEDENGNAVDKQSCMASILIRTVGKEAETWIKTFRHLTKRNKVCEIWYATCGAEKLEYTSPIIPRKINYFGKNSQIAFDVRFKLYYDECISTGWQPLEGIDFTIKGNVHVEDKQN